LKQLKDLLMLIMKNNQKKEKLSHIQN
jgi:hypothetical protein